MITWGKSNIQHNDIQQNDIQWNYILDKGILKIDI